MERQIYILMNKNQLSPYAVFIGTSFDRQQISPWYFRRGNAVRFLKRYLARHSASPAFDNNRKGLLKKVTFVERSN